MKSHRLTLLLSLFITLLSPFAALAGSRAIDDYTDMVDSLKQVQKNVKDVGLIPPTCPSCAVDAAPDMKVDMAQKEIDLARPSIYKDNTPFIIHLKRTKDSPLKVTLKFKNGHEECAKMYIGTNPFLPNGPLIAGCLMKMTTYNDDEIDLNLKKYPLPKDGEDQIIEVKITKPDVRKSFYALDVEAVKGPASIVKSKGKKFWSEGYNVDLAEVDHNE